MARRDASGAEKTLPMATITGRTDRQTDRETDRRTECDAICGPLLARGPHNKAFDSVAHDKLFAHFSQYGIKSNLLEWLEFFLKSHTPHKSRLYIVFHHRVDEWGSTGQWNRSNRISHFS